MSIPSEPKIEPCPGCGSECVPGMLFGKRYIACTNEACEYVGPNLSTYAEAIALHNRQALAMQLLTAVEQLGRFRVGPNNTGGHWAIRFERGTGDNARSGDTPVAAIIALAAEVHS
jgi:hypothetical protein